jgi:hypothetical protein
MSSDAALAEGCLAAVGASALAVVDWIATEFALDFGQCKFPSTTSPIGIH